MTRWWCCAKTVTSSGSKSASCPDLKLIDPAMDHRMKALVCLLLAGGAWPGAADTQPPVPRVEALYPSASTLPANHLKFYIHFSVPMRQGVFLEHCKVLDDHGRAVLAEPFRETELWSEDGRRLTLWFHPGRQKTGVNLNTEIGPVLSPGLRYTLVISGAWPSADGVPCGTDTVKTFFAGPRETRQLDATAWKLRPPAAGSNKPLEIRFPAPLDHALLMRCLEVVAEDGKPLRGTVSSTEAERVWRFTPARSWTGGPHRVIVRSILEDLAGNSLARPFEVDLSGAPPAKVPATISLPFTPAGS
jgi:hypothetical protein